MNVSKQTDRRRWIGFKTS